jgi:cytochrome c oxidase subunit 3
MSYSKDLSPEIRKKMNLNLIYVVSFSVTMLFAGLTSAYIVSMGAGFWLKFALPSAFYWSTFFIALSSISFIISLNAAKKNKSAIQKISIFTTFILGILFVVFQFRGFSKLIERGIHPAKNYLLVTDGRYGDYFEIKYKGDFIEVDGNDYKVKGRNMTIAEYKELQNFTKQFINPKQKTALRVKENPDFTLVLNGSPLQIKKQLFYISDTIPMEHVDEIRLGDLAINIRDKRGDFFARGNYGEDFTIYFKGKPLKYKNRELVYKNRVLSPSLQIKAAEAADAASSYLFILTALHVLHMIITLFFLVVVVINSFSNKYNSNNYLQILTTGVFWHFLGILWVYLLLFLVFIH